VTAPPKHPKKTHPQAADEPDAPQGRKGYTALDDALDATFPASDPLSIDPRRADEDEEEGSRPGA
jgi:hypothetical protein